MISKELSTLFMRLFLWEVIRAAIVAGLIALGLRILGVQFSTYIEAWNMFGFVGVGFLILLFLFNAIRKVEKRAGKYERRLLGK